MYSFPGQNEGSTPSVLTIAGSDSGGGAGIQADLKTFTALGCYGASVVTALTAQNTKGVQAVHAIPPSFVEEQLRSVLDDIKVAAIKTGMLANVDIVRAVARTLKALPFPLPPLVVDPVCVSTSGHTLLQYEALGALTDELLPLAAVLTPNKSEAELLLYHLRRRRRDATSTASSSSTSMEMEGSDLQITSIDDMLRAARELCALCPAGPRAVLLKGGHARHMRMADVEAAAAAVEGLRVEYDGGLSVMLSANMEILSQATAARESDSNPVVVDVLCEVDDGSGGDGGGAIQGSYGCTLFVRPFLYTASTHGTGCTLSAALACALARGESARVRSLLAPATPTPPGRDVMVTRAALRVAVVDAVKFATMYTHHGIATAFPVSCGDGCDGPGPLNHMHPLLPRVLHRPTRSDPYPLVRTLICSNADAWKEYVQHGFVKQLGQGTLPRECFIHFLKQDYLYLKYYSRANGLLVAKSPAYADFRAAAETILAIVEESKMHVSFCAQWGVGIAELEGTLESPACTAYGAYIMDVGLQGDAVSLLMALLACLLGYGEVGLWLQREAKRPQSGVQIENNPYKKWIEDYSGERYQAAVKVGIGRIEALAIDDPPSPKRLEHWKEIWGRCTRLEKQFWDMAMNLS